MVYLDIPIVIVLSMNVGYNSLMDFEICNLSDLLFILRVTPLLVSTSAGPLSNHQNRLVIWL